MLYVHLAKSSFIYLCDAWIVFEMDEYWHTVRQHAHVLQLFYVRHGFILTKILKKTEQIQEHAPKYLMGGITKNVHILRASVTY